MQVDWIRNWGESIRAFVASVTNKTQTRMPKSSGRWYWRPAVVLLLGILSLAMLTWTDRIGKRQGTHFAFADALMDLRIHAATSHLWFEEAFVGGPGSQIAITRAWADVHEATRLSELLLNGGECEYGWTLPPLKEPELKKRAENVRRLLSEFARIAGERYRSSSPRGAGTALDERADRVFDELQSSAHDLEEVVEGNHAADEARSRRLFFGIFLAWCSVVATSATGVFARDWRRKQAEEALQRAKDELETRVLERTTELRILNDKLSHELNENRKMQDALMESEMRARRLSAGLLMAQETERRRISRELHDELGQALTLMKLRIRLVDNELRSDQPAARDQCEDLSKFIDQVIEDVRRLARGLGPSILEDLGLSAALRWLVSHYAGDPQTKLVSSFMDIDRLFTHNAQIVIYRIIQEALTNIAKHAEAEHVSLIVERHGDRLSFVVEDDGKGFDVRKAATTGAAARGLGLATMEERARMLGGSISVWSEEGKGTRVALGVPVEKGAIP